MTTNETIQQKILNLHKIINTNLPVVHSAKLFTGHVRKQENSIKYLSELEYITFNFMLNYPICIVTLKQMLKKIKESENPSLVYDGDFCFLVRVYSVKDKKEEWLLYTPPLKML